MRKPLRLALLRIAALHSAFAHVSADELLLTPEQRSLPFESEVLASLGDRSDIIWEREIPVPMRDGVALSTDVIRLKSAAGKLPAILLRTPYTKTSSLIGERHPPRYLLQAGYALVLQNERGTGWSDGDYRFLTGAKQDGYDTLTWIARQPWSNGRVGMVGCSSLGENQLALGALGHPALRALIAESPAAGIGSIPGVRSQGAFYRNGVPVLLPWLDWYMTGNGHRFRPKLPGGLEPEQRARIAEWYYPFIAASLLPQRASAMAQRVRAASETLPSGAAATALGFPQTEFEKLITLGPSDPYWDTVDLLRGSEKIKIPALYVETWFDLGTYDLIQLYKHVSDEADQHLIVSATSHCRHRTATAHTYAGARYIGDARLDYEKLYIAWFDHWLKERSAPMEPLPKVQLYMLGANQWLAGEQWPVEAAQPEHWYLTSTGLANGSNGHGLLTRVAPGRAREDSFVSDPLRPVELTPPICCQPGIVRDQRAVAARDDVLVYTSEPLEHGLAISGEIGAELSVSANVRDTDLAVSLSDVYPDGRAYNVTESILRLRYRSSFDRPELLEPGRAYRVSIPGMVATIYFPPGHRIQLQVAGSNFPNYERNMNTGGRNFDEALPIMAHVTLHSGANHASRLTLPVIPGWQRQAPPQQAMTQASHRSEEQRR